jgi:hypothetical protein
VRSGLLSCLGRSMADAWSTRPGEKPKKPDVASIIREAQQSTEHAGDASLSEVGLDGATLRHTDIGDTVGGGSTLGKAHLGSAAVTAALTLHPCIHISGAGDASREVLHAMLSQCGPCSIQLVQDDETGARTGEASATFATAQQAEAAIRAFDGSRIDEGVLHVTVAKRAAQGSLTTRGRGRGNNRGKGGGPRITFAERQRDLITEQREQQAMDERDAFAQARRAAASASTSSASLAPRPVSGAAAGLEAKRRKLNTGLPSMLVVKPAMVTAAPYASPAPPPSQPVSAPAPSGALMGLADYGSDDDSDG